MAPSTWKRVSSPSTSPDPTNEAVLGVQLAACYRLVAYFGMDDLIYNHISVRVPCAAEHFLINPYGLLFSEVTASCFVKIYLEGREVEPSHHEVNQAGFIIHSTIHAAREDAICVMHAYEGVALDTDERARLVADIGPHKVLVLRDHGVLTTGRTIPEAFILMYYFEGRACADDGAGGHGLGGEAGAAAGGGLGQDGCAVQLSSR